MAGIPQPMSATVQAIYRMYEQRAESEGGHRAHLGASVIGHQCERHLWMLFRWCGGEPFSGRMLRLFDTGKRAEARFVEELRGIGCEVHDTDESGQQWRVSAIGGHFGGSMDGAAIGVPEAPKTWHVCEFKTHNAKSYAALESKGVRESKPVHYAQMQVYMGLTGMDRALYMAENKDTSALYVERIEFDKLAFGRLMARAERVITASTAPIRISDAPEWFECRYCSQYEGCHGTRAPEVNCRTCAHSSPVMDGGAWRCERHDTMLTDTHQRAGCASHLYIPSLIANIGRAVDSDGQTVTYERQDGARFVNGPGGFASAEIRAAEDKGALADPAVQAIKSQIKTARLIG